MNAALSRGARKWGPRRGRTRGCSGTRAVMTGGRTGRAAAARLWPGTYLRQVETLIGNAVASSTTQRSPRTVTPSPGVKRTTGLRNARAGSAGDELAEKTKRKRRIRSNSCWVVLSLRDSVLRMALVVQMRRGCKISRRAMPIERLLHDTALHAAAASVNEPHLAQAGGVCLVDVLLDDRRDIGRRKRVEIERAFDGNPQRVSILHRAQLDAGLSYRAVTSVLMPPRTEKSPTTVIRRG